MRKLLRSLFARRNGRLEPPSVSKDATPRATPTPPFEPLNDLERLLVSAATDPAQRPAFQRLLLTSDLWIATPVRPLAPSTRSLKAGEELELLTVQGPDEKQVLAAFTAEARLAATFGVGQGYLRSNGEAVLEMAAARNGLFLNPGGAYSVHWEASGVASMLGRPEGRVLTEPLSVMLATPSSPPTALVEQLRGLLGSNPVVAEAWFALAKWPNDNSLSWYLDVRTTADRAQIQALMSDVFRGGPWNGLPLDMVVGKPGDGGGHGIRVAPLQSH